MFKHEPDLDRELYRMMSRSQKKLSIVERHKKWPPAMHRPVIRNMKAKRGFVCRICCFLVGDARIGLGLAGEGLTVLGFRPKTIPLSKVAGLSSVHVKAFRRGVVEIPLTDQDKVVFSCLPAGEAESFVHALNEALQEIWHRKVEPHFNTIELLADVVDRLESPRNYPAACLVEPFWQKADKIFRHLPDDLPASLLPLEIRNSFKKVVEFHKLPDRIRDSAIERYMETEMLEMVDFFNRIEQDPLTREQRQAVICDEDATLVLAGAGSGKTSVITAKAAYLIGRGIRKPKEILLMAFGSNAAKEMSERIRQHCDSKVEAMTFHKLAYDIIAEVEGRKPPLATHATDEKEFKVLLKDILFELASNDRKIGTLLLRWFGEFFIPAKSEWDFENLHEYFSYVESHELRTLQGERVRSFEELEIANWLCMSGIAYEYEPVYEHELLADGRKDYTPDFRLTESGVYIEHFGVRREKDGNGNLRLTTAPYVDREEYLAGMEWKRKLHARHGTILVETFSYEKSEGKLLSALGEKLSSYVIPNPMSTQEILSRLENMGQFDDFSATLGTFLRHFKGSGSTLEKCRNKAIGLPDSRRGVAFLEIFEPVYETYQDRLGRYIDFDDMISQATKHVKENSYKSPYRHLLVDEFQDMSRGRADLLIALRNQNAACRIFAVGDDWQSIYRFSGSDIHLMRDFGHVFGGTFGNSKGIHQTVDLGRTFRSVDKIAHPARRFILQNPFQIKKEVIPADTSSTPAIQVLWSGADRTGHSVDKVLSQILKWSNGERTTVLLIGRYSCLRPVEFSRLSKSYPSLSLSFKTIHASKGLEADHVVILGANSGRLGLPSEILDDPLLDLVFPEPDSYEHAEERRVFYVALTRARKSVTIIAREDQPSSFVNELLEDNEYGVVEIGKLGQSGCHRYPCSRCGGHLFLDSKSRYLCEHRKNCGAILPACSECGIGLPLRNRHSPEFSRCECGAKFPTCSACMDGWLVERRGKYGPFLGCVRYPSCKGRKSA